MEISAMTIELTYLFLTASLWIPYIVGVNTTPNHGGGDPFARLPDLATMPEWIHRVTST